MWFLLLACRGPGDADADAPKHPRDTDTSAIGDTGDTGDVPDSGDVPDTGDTGDTGGAPSPLLMLAGGGTEGDNGDPTSWSAVLYGGLLENGDVTGDGAVHVLVLSTAEETTWIPEYFVELGATSAENLRIATRERAEAEELRERFAAADVVFLKGGDQGEYYDRWNDTLVEEGILGVLARGGAVGGTSAGAMSQAEYALAGGNDYVSADALLDSHTPYLDDVSDGGSGIHADFLGLLPGTLVDTHFAVRGRLGRLAGAMAKAMDEGAPDTLVGIGLDEQTGVLVRDGVARVVGVGSVTVLRRGEEDALRVPGSPLVWAGLRVDRLTDGWVYDLGTFTAAPGTSGAEVPPPAPAPASPDAEDWFADGSVPAHEERFGVVVERAPDAYAVREGTTEPRLPDAIGMMDAFDSDRRGAADEAMWRALADGAAVTGFWVGDGGRLERSAETPGTVTLGGRGAEPMATMVLTVDGMTWRSSSPAPSPADAGDGALHAAGVVGARLDILYTDGPDGRAWSLEERRPVE